MLKPEDRGDFLDLLVALLCNIEHGVVRTGYAWKHWPQNPILDNTVRSFYLPTNSRNTLRTLQKLINPQNVLTRRRQSHPPATIWRKCLMMMTLHHPSIRAIKSLIPRRRHPRRERGMKSCRRMWALSQHRRLNQSLNVRSVHDVYTPREITMQRAQSIKELERVVREGSKRHRGFNSLSNWYNQKSSICRSQFYAD